MNKIIRFQEAILSEKLLNPKPKIRITNDDNTRSMQGKKPKTSKPTLQPKRQNE